MVGDVPDLYLDADKNDTHGFMYLTESCCHGCASLRLEGEPVRALSCLLRVALHPGSMCGARRVCAAAADVCAAA